MKLKALVFYSICIFTIFSCKKNNDVTVSTTVTAKVMLNVSYGADPLQNMDVYLPSFRSTATTKVMILIHGGSWSSGDKADVSQYVDTFKRRLPDYAIFNINYRLATSSSTLFPTQENDIKTAVQFILDQSNANLVSNKVAILGVSAGGHLALLQAYKNIPQIKAKAVVSFFGPTDLTDMYNNPANPLIPTGLVQVIGKTPTQDPLIYSNSSPINFVTDNVPPTLLLQGGKDDLVKTSQATSLQTKLLIAGVSNQYIFYPNEGHGWFGATLSDSFDKIQTFLTLYVN